MVELFALDVVWWSFICWWETRLVEHHEAFPVYKEEARYFFARWTNCLLALCTNNVVIVDVDVIIVDVDIHGGIIFISVVVVVVVVVVAFVPSPSELPSELPFEL